MKETSQIKKIVSELMIFLLLIQFTGCYSTKIISGSDLPLSDSVKHTYIIHIQNSKFLLDDAIISNGILSGKIDTVNDSRQIGKKIHIFLLSDSVMKINEGMILSVPLDGIKKVEMAKVDVFGTIIVVGFCALGFLLVVGWALLSSSGGLNLGM
jgi:hypothetical protein